MEDGFRKADSSNLPKIDAMMVGFFFKSCPDLCSAEFRNVKTSISSRQSYGDDAIGHVQLKRDSGLCTVKCKICPEHKVRTKGYSVTMVVNEKEEIVESIQCHDCAASLGSCKHAIAFLMWVHRRSEEPSCTSVECYWRKSKLSKVGSTLKFITAKDLANEKHRFTTCKTQEGSAILTEFLKEGKKRKLDCEILKHQPECNVQELKTLSMHNLMVNLNKVCKDSDAFLVCISDMCNDEIVKNIEQETREQDNSCLWHEIRYARITASKAFEVSRCKTDDGCLVAAIMGARLPDTPAMKRGRVLEDQVRQAVKEKLGKNIKRCGIFVSPKLPVIAASPDGICEDAIVEIKCPTNEKTFKTYYQDGKKYMAQMQIQMFATGMNNCYFCVADTNFESTNKVTISIIHYDADYVESLLNASVGFWKKNIYPLLFRSTILE